MEHIDYRLAKKEDDTQIGTSLMLRLFKPYKGRLIVILLIQIVSSAIAVAIPYFLKVAVDENISNKDAEGLLRTVGILAIFIILNLLAGYIQIRYTGVLGQKILFTLRKKIFRKLQSLPVEFFSVNKSGDIIQRITSDVDKVNQFLSEGVVRILGLVFNLIFVVVSLYLLSPQLTFVALGTLVLGLLFLVLQSSYIRRITKQSLDIEGVLSSNVLEVLSGFKLVKTYGAESIFMNKFKQLNQDTRKSAIKTFALGNLSTPILDTLSRLGTAGILIYGLSLYTQNTLSLGDVIAYTVYLEQFYWPLNALAQLWLNIQGGLAAADRINDLLTLKSNIKEAEHPYNPRIEDIKGHVQFKDVSFKYSQEDEFILKELDLDVEAGEKIAIVGPTGAGKTTFVNLIARLYDASEGNVLIDGINVKKWDLKKLRHQVGYLLQDSFLFEGTIYDNLVYPNLKLTKEEVKEVFKRLDLDDFLNKLPKKLDTVIGKGADNLSAGQKQILAIVRLIIRKPKIIILDEATASVDTRTEKVLQKAITEFTQNSTAFIIAHRLNTIENADKIAFIYDNRIVEYGTHKDLLDKKGFFYKLYSQYKKQKHI